MLHSILKLRKTNLIRTNLELFAFHSYHKMQILMIQMSTGFVIYIDFRCKISFAVQVQFDRKNTQKHLVLTQKTTENNLYPYTEELKFNQVFGLISRNNGRKHIKCFGKN